ncbi:adhesion G protein-coupled receptor L2, partial [Biomphalaria glabrata]
LEMYLFIASHSYRLDIRIAKNPFLCTSCQHKAGTSVIFFVEVNFYSLIRESRTQLETRLIAHLLQKDFLLTLSDTVEVLLQPSVQFNQSQSFNKRGLWNKHSGDKNVDFKLLGLSSLMLCKYVSFNETDYQLTVNDTVTPPDVSISIDFNVTKIIIKDNKDLIMIEVTDEGILNVCVDLLDRILYESERNSKHSGQECTETMCLIEYILTLTCFSLSAVCLLLTMLTYLMFPELRTMVGLNNFFLSCSLLMAQMSLLASIRIFQSGVHCQVLGVVTHFLWLWNFSWSFICSYRMLLVFTDQTRSCGLITTKHEMWKFVCVSFALPVSAVLTCIGYHFFVTEGRDIGYGKVRCYLDSNLSVGIAVAVPVLAITLVNLTFFLKVVYAIHQVRTLQSWEAPGTDFEITIYAKLSTFTGMFWIVAFLAETMASDILK